jgi:hypothetical protein
MLLVGGFKICIVMRSICGFSMWDLFPVPHTVSRILKWLQVLWKDLRTPATMSRRTVYV